MATIVSLLVDDVAVDRTDREIPKPAVIDLYNMAMRMLIMRINCVNIIL